MSERFRKKEFRFCGKEVVQHDDYSITVSAKDNTQKIRPIKIPAGKKLTSPCTPAEVTQVRSVTAALAWVGRQTRPDQCYRVSRMQTLIKDATKREMKECNEISRVRTHDEWTRSILLICRFHLG